MPKSYYFAGAKNAAQLRYDIFITLSLNFSTVNRRMSSIWEKLKDVKIVRKLVYAIVGIVTYPGLAIINKLKISGTEHLEKLPKGNVLFVSNHQTYFADVITFLHIFCAV